MNQIPSYRAVLAARAAAEIAIEATPYLRQSKGRGVRPRDWLYGRHLIRKFVSATIAPGGVGKSSLTVVEALAMATGRDLLDAGLPKKPAMRVLLYNLEDPQDEIVRRVEAACTQHDITDADIGMRLHIVSGRDCPFVITEPTRHGVAINKQAVEELIAELRYLKIDVVIIDPFVSSHAAQENDNGAIDLIVKEWGRIAERADCAIELVHHTTKIYGDDIEVKAEAARGGSSFVGACRDVRVVNRMSKKEAERYGVEEPRGYFRVYSDKLNMAPPSDRSVWFSIVNVNLENGFEDDDGSVFDADEVGAVVRWQPPSVFEDVTADHLRSVQDAIRSSVRYYRKSVQSPDWIGLLVADVLGLDGSPGAHRERIKRIVSTWIETGALVERVENDANRRPRAVIKAGVNVDDVLHLKR